MLLDEDHRAVQDAVRTYVRERVAPQAARWDRESHFPAAWVLSIVGSVGRV